MKKLITIPDEDTIVNSLKKMAVDEGKSFAKFIEDKLVEIAEEYNSLAETYGVNSNKKIYRVELTIIDSCPNGSFLK